MESVESPVSFRLSSSPFSLLPGRGCLRRGRQPRRRRHRRRRFLLLSSVVPSSARS